ncbi:DEAD/DEAH box helicase [Nocardia terpenica]|uniref:DEAD/DEAH box helicase n=1 Tax=Nocardia terpenica TaxID=455432 RepID=UPI000834D718|nr:DEAD/DEAH box helicase [Nocardia terpenica]NQE86042.1 DEAD/DEAH box helicase family protein [Nocardia terpenica]
MERYPGELDTLRAENLRLRNLLRLTPEQVGAADPDQTSAGTPVDMRSRPEAKVRFYADLFRCRTDVYAVRWENKRDGRSGWIPAINGRWVKGANRDSLDYRRLTPDVIAKHLRGDQHIGFYALGDDDTCWWVAADFDKDTAMLDALAYVKAARAKDIPAALEVSQSGRGAHVWIFFAHAVSAATARRLATGLLAEAIALRGSMSLTSYDRLFPSQDTHTGKGMGNLIAAPLNGARRQHGTTLFLDPATLEPFDDQWEYLSSIPRLSSHDLTRLTRMVTEPTTGNKVRNLSLPTSSKIIPRPAALIRTTFAARLTLTAADLGPAMISAVKHAASIPNPEFFDRQRARRSTWDTPRFIRSYDETLDGDLILPRGLLTLLTTLVESADSTLNIDDKRVCGTAVQLTCATELRPEQRQAVQHIEAHEHSIVVAPPGTGKTVIACAAIASRSTSTLVLVDRKALADQWRQRLHEHLGVRCGQIGGGRSKTTGSVDIALLPTLTRRNNIAEITGPYGFIVVDECHHVAASAFTDVLNQIPARYWLGLTATPQRRDQLEDLIYHQLGANTHTITAPSPGELPTAHTIPAPHRQLHVHPTSFVYTGDADPAKPGGIAEIYRALTADELRCRQIVDDVLRAHKDGAHVLVLTRWVKHLTALADALTAAGCTEVIQLKGGMKASERRNVQTQIDSAETPLLIVGTTSYIGEGFDCPRLDTLFLAAPVTFPKLLVQYAGRITRTHAGKTIATVHDYHDALVPVIASSLLKRASGYVELGFPDPRKRVKEAPGPRTEGYFAQADAARADNLNYPQAAR